MKTLAQQEPDVQVLDNPKPQETGFVPVRTILHGMFLKLLVHGDMLANERTTRDDR